jgi:protocatechuate 3,4-dioxygenase beta subunit
MTMSSPEAPESPLAAPNQVTQWQITEEIVDAHGDFARREKAGEVLPATMRTFAPYRSNLLRHPTKNPKLVDPETIELYSPAFGHRDVARIESDLTTQHAGEPIGERMLVRGRVLDSWGRPVPNQLVEVWQANASGRYIHQHDQHPAPLDPNFTGAGRAITDARGEYSFTTIKPGPYPWKNFPGDPLFPLDPIYNTIWRQQDRDSLVAAYDHNLTSPEWATGYRFDIVVDGPEATYFEQEGE